MKRRKTFQHPDQLELALLFQANGEAATDSPAGNDQRASKATPASSEDRHDQLKQERTPRRRKGHKEPSASEPEFAQMHETGWQASAPPSLPQHADTAAEPESAASGSELCEPSESSEPSEPGIQESRLWSDTTWTVRVVRHETNVGWAAEIHRNGEAEPVLVCPWEVDRDKNPKPLDDSAFATLVKTAADMRRRHERQLQAMLHKSVTVETRSAVITVTLDIVPDEDDSHALLAAVDESGTQLAKVRVAPGFKLSQRVASAWIDSGYRKVERP